MAMLGLLAMFQPSSTNFESFVTCGIFSVISTMWTIFNIYCKFCHVWHFSGICDTKKPFLILKNKDNIYQIFWDIIVILLESHITHAAHPSLNPAITTSHCNHPAVPPAAPTTVARSDRRRRVHTDYRSRRPPPTAMRGRTTVFFSPPPPRVNAPFFLAAVYRAMGALLVCHALSVAMNSVPPSPREGIS